MRRSDIQPAARQPHRRRVHRQDQLGWRRQRLPDEHRGQVRAGHPGQQHLQILGAGDPHGVPQPPVRGVVPGRHHPHHRTVRPPPDRRPAHPRQHIARGQPTQRHLVLTHRPARPHPGRVQIPRHHPGPLGDHAMAGHHHRRTQQLLITAHDPANRVWQRHVPAQHRKVMQRVDTLHRRPYRRDTARRQTVHLDHRADLLSTGIHEHMPSRHQQPRRHLKTSSYRLTAVDQHPPQKPRDPHIPGHDGAPRPTCSPGVAGAGAAADRS